jgi:WD40 repeat protein
MDGSFLASGGGDGRIVLWDTRTGRRVQDFPGHDGIVRALAFSPDGRLLASGSGEREQPGAATRGTSDVRIWNVQAGRPKRISP